jgi:hypothetical protein
MDMLYVDISKLAMQSLFPLLELWGIHLDRLIWVNLMETNPCLNFLGILFLWIKQRSQDCLKELLEAK